MRLGLVFLVLAYVLSQFYRAFLAVLTPMLKTDLGATAEDLSRASGLWFLAFALMQLPVGWALDRIGPRTASGVLLAGAGGGGAALFAMADGPGTIQAAMVLIGIGCSPVLMASYYIFARIYSARVFATLAGAVIGIGSLGNVASALPLAWAVELYGWRETIGVLGALTLAIGLLLLLLVKDPPRLDHGDQRGSVLDLLRMPALWFIFPIMFVSYAPAAGIRGLWLGPYMADVFGLDAVGLGRISLLMAFAMILGNFAYGPLDRLFGTRKWVVLGGNLLGAAAIFALAALPAASVAMSTGLLIAIGLFGASFPLVVAHGRSLVPPHLIGRGVTLLNLFGIGGVGIFQIVTGRIYDMANGTAAAQPGAYAWIFLFFGISLLIGCLIYLGAEDRTD